MESKAIEEKVRGTNGKVNGLSGVHEERRQNFVRLSGKRMQMVLEKMRILANCARKGQYEWTESDVNNIVITLERAIMDLKMKFSGNKYQYFSL